MTLATLSDIHKSHRGKHLLRGVSLTIADGERLGLLGPNGCGKSTLLRILAGVEEPDSGERVLRQRLRLGYLEQEPRLPPAARVRDVVRAGLEDRGRVLAELDRVHASLAGSGARAEAAVSERALLARQAALEDELSHLGGHDVEHRVEALLEHLGLARTVSEAECGTLSGGEARRVALARVLLGQPELLLLDEPTNHLDAEVIAWLEQLLVGTRTPVLMITHDRYVLDRVADRILELDRGELHSYEGGYGDFLVARAERDEREAHVESSRLNLLRRETAWMRRGPPARTTKAKARIDRYAALVAARPEGRGDSLAFRIPEGPRLGDRVLRLHGVRKGFGGRLVIPSLDLELAPGERLGIVGPNGAGKSTLLKLCTGELAPDAGKVSIGDSVVFAAIDQQRSALHPENSVLTEIAGSNQYVKLGERSRRVEGFLEQFLFPGAAKHALVGTLSGGERNRVLLGQLLCAGGNVLVLDEPTNDLDLMTLRALEEALVAFEGCVLVVSHDRWFLDRVATRVVHLDGAGGVTVHSGDLTGLLGEIALARGGAAADRSGAAANAGGARGAKGGGDLPAGSGEGSTPSKAARTAVAPPRTKSLSYKETAECDALPDRVAAAEAELAAIDARIASPELYQGPPAERQRVLSQRDGLAERVAQLLRRWEELEARR
ncbi:MAG TPA: ATP-binding cassette domain-containing protein [Planctomycetota bacterium]|nr:ATP-binding cassette domain-containing protein [Planctomycetota bacterium]